MVNGDIDPVVVCYMSKMKEMNITVTYFHDSQERSTFLLLIILPVTSHSLTQGRKEKKWPCLFSRSKVHH